MLHQQYRDFIMKKEGEVSMEEYTWEPCPWRIVDDCGGVLYDGQHRWWDLSDNQEFLQFSSGSKPQTVREFDRY